MRHADVFLFAYEIPVSINCLIIATKARHLLDRTPSVSLTDPAVWGERK